MKLVHFFFAALMLCLPPLMVHGQMGTACIGCMPRTGPVYDSTMTTPAPAFTTSASTGDVYIPPREVTVTVPGPMPPGSVSNDPYSFESTKFTCNAGGVGMDGAAGATLALYKSLGGRCADSDGMMYWATNLVNCVAGKEGWSYANGLDTGGYSGYTNNCGIDAGIDANIGVDQPSMNAICAADAATRGFATTAYNYVRGTYSTTCSK